MLVALILVSYFVMMCLTAYVNGRLDIFSSSSESIERGITVIFWPLYLIVGIPMLLHGLGNNQHDDNQISLKGENKALKKELSEVTRLLDPKLLNEKNPTTGAYR